MTMGHACCSANGREVSVVSVIPEEPSKPPRHLAAQPAPQHRCQCPAAAGNSDQDVTLGPATTLVFAVCRAAAEVQVLTLQVGVQGASTVEFLW